MQSTKRRTTRTRRPQDLTVREQQVLQLIWNGLPNREIASRLKIAVKTVESHRAMMMKKVRVTNTAQLLKTAIEQELVSVES